MPSRPSCATFISSAAYWGDHLPQDQRHSTPSRNKRDEVVKQKWLHTNQAEYRRAVARKKSRQREKQEMRQRYGGPKRRPSSAPAARTISNSEVVTMEQFKQQYCPVYDEKDHRPVYKETKIYGNTWHAWEATRERKIPSFNRVTDGYPLHPFAHRPGTEYKYSSFRGHYPYFPRKHTDYPEERPEQDREHFQFCGGSWRRVMH
mmetsp:Transcript_395/g.740  ORF Transcript_395/g.740 Transcript_395/m.740 type:complete len:204 (+) Transcript_395:41-652(+)